MVTAKQAADYRLRMSSIGMRAPVNFVRIKFLQLPAERQQEIFDCLHSEEKSKIIQAETTLLDFVEENPFELSNFVAPRMPEWTLPEALKEKTKKYLGEYFKEKLQQLPNGKFSIAEIL